MVTVTGVLFRASAPAEAPVTVRGGVAPPPYAENVRREDPPPSVKFFEEATVMVPVVLAPVALAVKF